MTNPKLAIMDEATSGLDVINALEIRNMIKDLAKTHNMSFLLSSHNMLEIEYLSDRVGLITAGKITAQGTVAELKAKYNAANLEEIFVKAVNENEVL
jgi:ABC-2 type transport system ATP-binding protein